MKNHSFFQYVLYFIVFVILIVGCSYEDKGDDKYTWFDKYYEYELIPIKDTVWVEVSDEGLSPNPNSLNVSWHNKFERKFTIGNAGLSIK